MKRYEWQLQNIICTSCARNVERYFASQNIQDIQVNVMAGVVSFQTEEAQIPQLQRDLAKLGYPKVAAHQANPRDWDRWLLIICIVLTLPLLLAHLFMDVDAGLRHRWLQFSLASPVYLIGCIRFGPRAYRSLWRWRPNMDVLIILGASAAYIYSLIGTMWLGEKGYMFFETAAAIFTIVMLGNRLEHFAMQRMRRALGKILRREQPKAHTIAFDQQRQEVVLDIASSELRVGDLVLINTGDQVPTDAKILWGEVAVDESIITGESLPVMKGVGDIVLGGSLLLEGSCRAQVRSELGESAIGKIQAAIAKIEASKPPVQLFADRLSAVFVPVVLLCALACFVGNWYWNANLQEAMMRAIAVLVVSCPCALGLAAPSAIFVGLSMAYKRGILFKTARNMEVFKNITQVVFDKTGTLTTGELQILESHSELATADFHAIILGLEQFSNHPIAQTLRRQWTSSALSMAKVREHKGLGLEGEDAEGNKYRLGSHKILSQPMHEIPKTLYLTKNNHCVGWVDLGDEIRPEAPEIIAYLRGKGLQVYMLSGDLEHKCQQVANRLGITQVYAECKPEDKVQIIAKLKQQAPLAMVGDGINDAPALAQSTLGISLGGATDIAVQSADIVLLNGNLRQLPFALGIGRATLATIYENFGWGLAYNVLAIPYAAMGGMSPVIASLLMGFSDLVLLINSARLMRKRIG